jgi:hypothetical protein
MKNILIVCLIFFASCKSTEQVKSNNTINETLSFEAENCPENGLCIVELIPNKTIEFKTDEFGNLYPIITRGEKTIFKYTFEKEPISGVADSNYTEIIYAELPKDFSTISLTNNQLSAIKLHFGRLCFCKGESGYFPIEKGAFNLKKTENNTLKIALHFSVKKVPQIVSEINETISLKSNKSN